MTLSKKNRYNKGYTIDETHTCNLLVDTREIFIHGYVDNTDEDPGVEYRMANNFVKNMRLLEAMDSGKDIVVHHHSVGGSWTEGMMVYDSIKLCPAPVIIITHGIAASMGSIIPQAADLRVSMPHCYWMIHEGYTDIYPGQTRKQAKSVASFEQMLDKRMMEIYAEVCFGSTLLKGKTKQQVKNYIQKHLDKHEDWWLTAQEALEIGFCDAIYGAKGYESMAEIRSHVS